MQKLCYFCKPTGEYMRRAIYGNKEPSQYSIIITHWTSRWIYRNVCTLLHAKALNFTRPFLLVESCWFNISRKLRKLILGYAFALVRFTLVIFAWLICKIWECLPVDYLARGSTSRGCLLRLNRTYVHSSTCSPSHHDQLLLLLTVVENWLQPLCWCIWEDFIGFCYWTKTLCGLRM